MEYLNWIDKKLDDINDTLLFGKYFDSILYEEGIDVFYLLNPELGIDLILRTDFFIKAIHFYSGKETGIKMFSGNLPIGLQFYFSRIETIAMLGKPDVVGGGDFSLIYGTTPFWDKYLFQGYSLNLQFSEKLDKIDLITISSLK